MRAPFARTRTRSGGSGAAGLAERFAFLRAARFYFSRLLRREFSSTSCHFSSGTPRAGSALIAGTRPPRSRRLIPRRRWPSEVPRESRRRGAALRGVPEARVHAFFQQQKFDRRLAKRRRQPLVLARELLFLVIFFLRAALYREKALDPGLLELRLPAVEQRRLS